MFWKNRYIRPLVRTPVLPTGFGPIISGYRTRCFSSILLFLVSLAQTDGAFAAGFKPLEIPGYGGEPAIEAMVWSPCANVSDASEIGPYIVQAVPDCAITDQSLPLVVISHGYGGSLLGHHDTATALADAGFVVLTLNHPGDFYDDDSGAHQLDIFESRPRDVSRAISFMQESWSMRKNLDPDAVGVMGFSRGGTTALILSGAVPSIPASAERFCSEWWSFVHWQCRKLKADEARITPHADPRIRAAVVMDPLNLFDASGLQSAHTPVQLWASENGGDGVEFQHVKAIRTSLPQVRDYRVARGAGHFAYLAPCSPAFRESAPGICEDPEGFDRVSWHREMNAAVVDFFKRQLQTQNRTGAQRGG